MCTAITYQTKDHYFGRNLDLEYAYNTAVTVTPRNYPLHFRKMGTIHSHYALIGMGSTLLDGVVVGEGAIVAAGSLVLKNTQIGPYEVWGGVPAKFIKKADPEQTNEINRKIAHNYAMYASWYKQDEENK